MMVENGINRDFAGYIIAALSIFIEAAQNTARQEQENAMQGAKKEIAQLAMQAAKKLLLEKSNENSNDMLYDKFLAKAGDANDTDRH